MQRVKERLRQGATQAFKPRPSRDSVSGRIARKKKQKTVQLEILNTFQGWFTKSQPFCCFLACLSVSLLMTASFL